MAEFLITTPLNPQYNETTLNLRFNDGRAVLNTRTYNTRVLRKDVPTVLKAFQDLEGYEITALDEEAAKLLGIPYDRQAALDALNMPEVEEVVTQEKAIPAPARSRAKVRE